MEAYVLLTADRKQVDEVGRRLSALDGVENVSVLAGQYDLLAHVQVDGEDELAEVVIENMVDVNGIQYSETMYSLRSYSE